LTALLEVAGVTAGYRAMPVLEDVTLEIAEREIVSVVGTNGAGKTTLLLTIAGHINASAGRVSFAGRPITNLPAHDHVADGLVMVPEGGRLFPMMTVLENLELGAYHPAARKKLRDNLEEVLAVFPVLAERRRQLAGSLSGGERQMCAVARAMMSMPRLLMLDEPSLGLAPIMVERLFDLIRKLVAEKQLAVLLVEQNVPDALDMCDRGYVLSRGRIVRGGTGTALLADPEIQQAYMGL
jgi:branched-chain amino acid transport system ATP-binding protein